VTPSCECAALLFALEAKDGITITLHANRFAPLSFQRPAALNYLAANISPILQKAKD
jgi:hypothetical protein